MEQKGWDNADLRTGETDGRVMDMRATGKRWWTGLLAAGVLACAAAGEAREPESITRLNSAASPEIAARIKEWRGRLDETFQGRFNFAWCRMRLEGGGEWEYIAHSSIGFPEDLTEDALSAVGGVLVMAIPEDERHYETHCVNRRNVIDGDDCWERDYDTEFKILEAITAELAGETDAAGHILLYTDLPPCASCRGVMRQFLERFPNLRLEVLYK